MVDFVNELPEYSTELYVHKNSGSFKFDCLLNAKIASHRLSDLLDILAVSKL
jgi:hypothetical protein